MRLRLSQIHVKTHLEEFLYGTVYKPHDKNINFITFTCPVLLIKNYVVWFVLSTVGFIVIFLEFFKTLNSLIMKIYCLYDYLKECADVLRVIPEDRSQLKEKRGNWGNKQTH